MRMRQNDRIDLPRQHRQRVPVSKPKLLVTLKKSAINKESVATMLNQIFGPGNGICSTQKGNGSGIHPPTIGHGALQSK